MHTYKTSDKQRERSLAYYYANREQYLAKYAAQRRAAGIPVMRDARAQQVRTREDRLTDILACNRCGRRITAPSNIVRRYKICTQCRYYQQKQRYARKGLTSKGRMKVPALEKIQRNYAKDFREYKALLWCVRCGSTETECLEFHHRDPATKSYAISKRWRTTSLKTLIIELEKCDVLCSNCHRKEHHKIH